MKTIITENLGEAWLAIMEYIMTDGKDSIYTDNYPDEFEVKEVLGLTVRINEPYMPDEIIEKYKNDNEYNWMKDNFTVLNRVKELYNAKSYAMRFRDYMDRKNQIDWVVKRLNEEMRLRSATITTFEPLNDEKYIPCVSMLDFNVEDNRLCLYCYCRALDFGTKAYANLALIYELQKEVADRLDLATGSLTLFVKSAHIYKPNFDRANTIVSANK